MFASEAAVADIQIKCDTKSLVKVVPRRVKISIASDFRKNNIILAAAILAVDQADQKKVGFLRTRHAPTPSKRMGNTELR